MAINPMLGALRGAAAGQGEPRVGGLGAPRATGETAVARPGGGRDFAAILEEAVGGVEKSQQVADDKAIAMVSGQDIPIHEVMVAATEAELAVQLTTAVAAKAIAAYQEIWRMEV